MDGRTFGGWRAGPQVGDADRLNLIVPGAMPETLAIVGLVLATVLYALMVRRRAGVRFGALSLSRALAASNEIGLSRLRASLRPNKSDRMVSAAASNAEVPVERRSGDDRRRGNERWRGRGRRDGGDRRRGAPTP